MLELIHANQQCIEEHNSLIRKTADRAPSLRGYRSDKGIAFRMLCLKVFDFFGEIFRRNFVFLRVVRSGN